MSTQARTNGKARRNGQSSGGATPPPKLSERKEFLDKVTDTGIDEEVATSIHNLLTQDFVLGNIRAADREYCRLMAENVVLYVTADHPPQDSALQGVLRMGLLGDMDDGRTALSERQKTEFKSLLLGVFFRTSRSVDGWQQDKVTESIQTRRVEDGRQQESDGILGGLFS